MPCETHPQDEVWMAWPTRTDNWRYGGKMAQQAFCDVAEAISRYTKVTMIVPSEQFHNARSVLSPEIRVLEMSFNDSWMRDIGATYLINGKGERRGISWQFNAWGGLTDGLY